MGPLSPQPTVLRSRPRIRRAVRQLGRRSTATSRSAGRRDSRHRWRSQATSSLLGLGVPRIGFPFSRRIWGRQGSTFVWRVEPVRLQYIRKKTPRRIGQPRSFEPGQVDSLLPGQVTRCSIQSFILHNILAPGVLVGVPHFLGGSFDCLGSVASAATLMKPITSRPSISASSSDGESCPHRTPSWPRMQS